MGEVKNKLKMSSEKRRRLAIEQLKSKNNKMDENQLISYYLDVFGVSFQTFRNDMKLFESSKLIKKVKNTEYIYIGGTYEKSEPKEEQIDEAVNFEEQKSF